MLLSQQDVDEECIPAIHDLMSEILEAPVEALENFLPTLAKNAIRATGGSFAICEDVAARLSKAGLSVEICLSPADQNSSQQPEQDSSSMSLRFLLYFQRTLMGRLMCSPTRDERVTTVFQRYFEAVCQEADAVFQEALSYLGELEAIRLPHRLNETRAQIFGSVTGQVLPELLRAVTSTWLGDSNAR